jgi:nicotinamide phosphoribosyltransferase
MMPENTTKIYSNLTPRKSRIPGIDKVVFFSLQHFILEYLIKKFNEDFFNPRITEYVDTGKPNPFYGEKNEKTTIWEYQTKATTKEGIIEEYARHIKLEDYSHIEKLWDLGYLPIEIKALEEGELCPIGVPCLTITNTHPEHAWLVNYLETLMSCMLWQGITSATISHEYKKILTKYALETTGSAEFVQWQGHDFSMRGLSSVESAILSGMGHLLSFTGTDTIPAIYQLEKSYDATGLIGASVPATEHSVMCMGQKESEIETFKRLLDLYPTGILSVVSDTWDLWKVCTEYLPQLKEEILARDGKLVIRPDSGDPVDILCGYPADAWLIPNEDRTKYKTPDGKIVSRAEALGVIELLWQTFGGTENEYGYKVLDSHIGAIYGDSITLDRATQICERLKAKGFASTNVVLGIGSYTYQYNTRDTFGFAVKATYGELTHFVGADDHDIHNNGYKVEAREIFKDPITDDGTKKSKKGLLKVIHTGGAHDIQCFDQQSWEKEQTGLLQTVFKDSKLVRRTTLEEIRHRLSL